MQPTYTIMKSWLAKLGGSEFKVMRLNDAGGGTDMLDTPETTVAYLTPQLADSLVYRPDVENFIVIYLNARLRPIGFQIPCTGTLDMVLVHPREVFKGAFVMNAHSLVIAHNHPSGDPSPSQADIKMTRDLIRAAQLLQFGLLDHIILGRATPDRPKSYSSLHELGYFSH
jgi:DNA repair protein RadC